jgi:hypothetical protein
VHTLCLIKSHNSRPHTLLLQNEFYCSFFVLFTVKWLAIPILSCGKADSGKIRRELTTDSVKSELELRESDVSLVNNIV